MDDISCMQIQSNPNRFIQPPQKIALISDAHLVDTTLRKRKRSAAIHSDRTLQKTEDSNLILPDVFFFNISFLVLLNFHT